MQGKGAASPFIPCFLDGEENHWLSSSGGGLRFLRTALSAHLDAVGVVNQTVEDAVGDGGIADLLVPARDRQLGSEDGGASS